MSTTTATATTAGPPSVLTSFARVPLTTTFTAPGAACAGIYLPAASRVYMIDDEASCLPPGYPTADTAFFYSPGLACPRGYWTACHDTAAAAAVTTVLCCPVRGDITLSCAGRSLRPLWESLQCTWEAPRSPGVPVTVTRSGDGRTSTVTLALARPEGINAYGIRMVFQSSDVVAVSGSASPSVPSGSAADPVGPPVATTEVGSGSGLSTGATVAIGVVVPVVVLAALCAGLFLWWRRRRRASQEIGAPRLPSELDPQWKPLGSNGAHYYGSPPAAHELQGTCDIAEMPSDRTTAELQATPARAAGGGAR